MIRLTIVLLAFLYIAMVIVPSDSGEGGSEAGADLATRGDFDPAAGLPAAALSGEALQVAAAPGSGPDRPLTITRADGEVLEISAVIVPSQQAETDVVHVARYQAPAAAPAPAETAVPDRPLVYVTGSRVNMRAGPSTANPVVTALGYGDEAELIETLDNGWMHIRHTESGRVGYMAGRFLSETRP